MRHADKVANRDFKPHKYSSREHPGRTVVLCMYMYLLKSKNRVNTTLHGGATSVWRFFEGQEEVAKSVGKDYLGLIIYQIKYTCIIRYSDLDAPVLGLNL